MDTYVTFYMQGRSDVADDGGNVEIDIDAMAARVLAGEDIYKVTHEVADAALRPRSNSSVKTRWQKENANEVKDAGGDKDRAYEQFLKGQVAELRYILEDETCDAIDEQLDDAGDEGDGDEDEPDGEGEGGAEGDEDEDLLDEEKSA